MPYIAHINFTLIALFCHMIYVFYMHCLFKYFTDLKVSINFNDLFEIIIHAR